MKRNKKEQKMVLNNSGFSLVELIIVIAIMAILVGVLAPQLLKYVDRSRQSADTQVADSVRTAVVTALMDPNVTDAPTGAVSYANMAALYGAPTNFANAIKATLNNAAAADIEKRLTSNAYKGKPIKVDIDANQAVTVTIEANAGSGASDLVIK